jgi:hypothetical protein
MDVAGSFNPKTGVLHHIALFNSFGLRKAGKFVGRHGLPRAPQTRLVFLTGGQRSEAAGMEHQRWDIRRDAEKFNLEKDKLVISNHNNSIDRTLKPDRSTADEQCIRRADLPIDTGEAVPRLGGKLPANVAMRLAENTHAHSFGSLQNSPGPGTALDTN